MQLVEQAPLWGRFGYSDLKEASFRVCLCIFYLTEVMRMACVVGATGPFRSIAAMECAELESFEAAREGS